MGAFVEHSFDGGFLLDEERIRKIRDIVSTRIAKHTPPLQPKFKVYRGDSYSYLTESLDDVTAEDNDDWRKITRLDVLVEQKDDLEFRMTFSKSGVELNIKGEDRDEVFLLFSDLREYINNDVAVNKGVAKISSRSLLVLLMIIMMTVFLGFLWSQAQSDNPARRHAALEAPDIQTKLNFLIEDAYLRNPGKGFNYSMIGVFILMPLVFSRALEKGLGYLFPDNEFLFGTRKQRFDRRRGILNNILWVVLVGMIVSVLAGIIVWYVTTNRG